MNNNNFKNALIGCTGFVGSNLAQAMPFDELYNSKNIGEIRNKSFNKIVCAGVSAVKWWANQNPEQDKAQIDVLLNNLTTIKAGTFILLSTVDVYLQPNGSTEDDIPDVKGLHAYGRHRLYVEDFVKTHFAHHHIIRLPALFGTGLKKNVIYDLLNSNGLDVINPRSSFQWYPLQRLANDMTIIEQADIPLVNLAVEPITTAVIQEHYFPNVSIGSNPAAEAHYDMHTKYSSLFKQEMPYMVREDEILSALQDFVETTQGLLL
jgi:hypothetical protein